MKPLLLILFAACTREATVYPPPELSTWSTNVSTVTGTDVTTPTSTTPTVVDTGPTTEPPPGPVLQFDGPVPKNVLWLSIDTLRKDHWGAYGDVDALPFLNSKLNEGLNLTDAKQCTNWTWAGTTCGMSGANNVDNGYIPCLCSQDGDRALDSIKYIAEVFSDENWSTTLVTTNGWLDPDWNNTQGFDSVVRQGGQRASVVLEKGLEQLEIIAVSDNPWFLHLHFYDPHAPYNPPEEYLGALDELEEVPWDLANRDQQYDARDDWPTMEPELAALLEAHLRTRYAAEVRYMDDAFAEWWDIYDAQGYLDDTLVVVWADHGEAFWEHGRQTHAQTLYNEENDVTVYFWAKNLQAGTFSGPASIIDVAPTVLDAQGIDIPTSWTGVPLQHIEDDRIRYNGTNAREGIIQSIIRDEERILFYWRSGLIEVTDASTDESETINLYDPNSTQTLELWSLLLPRVEQALEFVDTVRYTFVWPPDLPH